MNLQHQQQQRGENQSIVNGSCNNFNHINNTDHKSTLKLDDCWNDKQNQQSVSSLSASSSLSSTGSSTESSPSISFNDTTCNINTSTCPISTSQENFFSSNNSVNSKYLHKKMNSQQQQQQQDDSLLKTTEDFLDSKKTMATNNSPELLKRNFNSFKGTYKKQKEEYLTEKRRITNDMLTVMRDEKIIILADWLKIRGTLKNWIKLYCVLKPGILLMYKNEKYKVAGNWLGTILLNSCELLERPSKKHGFCFKLFHPLEKSIWASKGPDGETSLNMFLLPTFYLIFRAPTEEIGACWMNHLDITMKNLISTKRVLSNQMSFDLNASIGLSSPTNTTINPNLTNKTLDESTNSNNKTNTNINSNDIECDHFNEIDENNLSDSEKNSSDDDCSFNSSIVAETCNIDDDLQLQQTNYVPSQPEEFGELGNGGQTEEFADENKSLIWGLLKQVRPGMDLSKVILPTFILEPRSFLEKLTDFYYHSDILSECINDNDPFSRMKNVIKFYLSGFYKKPKGLKKPYNPVLGELFRCYWQHEDSSSKTFYVAEQVSHHPPVSAFYVTNRKEGFCIHGSVLARSKFYGNSVSALLEGQVKLVLLNRGEEYVITMPYANCKGILIGKLTMELGGKISIECEKTGYSTELEFKLRPLLGGIDASNIIEGKIKLLKNTVATLQGKWDDEVYIHDKLTDKRSLLWCPSKKLIESRLKRFTVSLDEQDEFESEKMWLRVSDAIRAQDQYLATEEKAKIEQKQREFDSERKLKSPVYETKYFKLNKNTNEWLYDYNDLRPWDNQIDQFQYENNFQINTKTVQIIKTEPKRTSHIDNDNPNQYNHQVQNENEMALHINQMKYQYESIQSQLNQIVDKIEKLNSFINSTHTNTSTLNGNFKSQLNSFKFILLVVFLACMFSTLNSYINAQIRN